MNASRGGNIHAHKYYLKKLKNKIKIIKSYRNYLFLFYLTLG